MRAVLVTAFSTSSSAASLPTALAAAREDLGVQAPVAGFVLPLGTTMNMSGTALFEGCVVLFIAQVFGIELGFAQQVTLVLLAVLSAVAVAAIPGGALPMVAGLLAAFGIPPEGIGIILGVERLLDMTRTMVNVGSDVVTTIVVDRYTKLRHAPGWPASMPDDPAGGRGHSARAARGRRGCGRRLGGVLRPAGALRPHGPSRSRRAGALEDAMIWGSWAAACPRRARDRLAHGGHRIAGVRRPLGASIRGPPVLHGDAARCAGRRCAAAIRWLSSRMGATDGRHGWWRRHGRSQRRVPLPRRTRLGRKGHWRAHELRLLGCRARSRWASACWPERRAARPWSTPSRHHVCASSCWRVAC